MLHPAFPSLLAWLRHACVSCLPSASPCALISQSALPPHKSTPLSCCPQCHILNPVQEALIAELSAKLQASSAASAELDGEVAAARMAVQGEDAELERTRRQLATADALVQRLMGAIAERGRTSPSKRPGAAAAVAVTAEAAHSSATTSSCGSPQSSIGSVAPRNAR